MALSWALSAAFSAMTSSYPLPSTAGFETGATWPTASEYFRYVSIEATTTRASTVIRSMPTSETRTHASITIPLSSTRSRTSMRLVPPAARSTGIRHSLTYTSQRRVLPHRRRRTATRQLVTLPLERTHLLAQLFVLGRQQLLARRQMVIELPPVEANLLRLVDRADEKPDPDRQEFDFRERHLDVACDDQPLVEDAIENVDE